MYQSSVPSDHSTPLFSGEKALVEVDTTRNTLIFFMYKLIISINITVDESNATSKRK